MEQEPFKETPLSLEFRQGWDLSSQSCPIVSNTHTSQLCTQAVPPVPEPDYLGSYPALKLTSSMILGKLFSLSEKRR